MHRIAATILLVVCIAAVIFSSYSFIQGRLEAGLSVLPFLVICYFFLVAKRRP